MVCPLAVDGIVVGTLQVFTPSVSAGLVRAVEEVATWVTGQLELAELDASRRRLVEAEVKTLRAQISPHFIYNSLNAIASFVRTDPEHARELLLEFADFTRYSFRSHGEFTTLAEELRSIERYLVLEKARFGDRLHVTLRVAPEVLPVTVPFLCLQPLVENAVRHGLEAKDGPGRIEIVAENHDQEAVIWVEDDGVGDDPEHVRRALAGESDTDSVGLGNVDGRLRSVFGDEFGLVVETAAGRRHQGHRPGAEVRPGGARVSAAAPARGRSPSTTSARPATSSPGCSPRPPHRDRPRRGVGRRGAARPPGGARRRRSSATSGCPASPAWSSPRSCAASASRRGSCSSPPTSSTRWRPSTSTSSTTCSSRSGSPGSPRRCAASWTPCPPPARAARTPSPSSSAG